MSLLKGSISLTRYRVQDQPPELTDEFISSHLQQNAILEIDSSSEEESVGWVEVLNPLVFEFLPPSYKFGDVLVFGLRVDTRRVPAKTVNRYLALAEAQAVEATNRPLNNEQRRELKSRVRRDLLARTPVTTDVYEVCWLFKKGEVWLAGVGSKLRERFEDLWRRTFSLGLVMKIPYLLAGELLPDDALADDLERLKPSALFGGGASGSD